MMRGRAARFVNRVRMAAILGVAKTTLDEWVQAAAARSTGRPGPRARRPQFDVARVVRWRLEVGDAPRLEFRIRGRRRSANTKGPGF